MASRLNYSDPPLVLRPDSASYRSVNLPTLETTDGTMVMVYNASSESKNVYPRIEVAGRTAPQAIGELQDHAVVQPGAAGYHYDDTRGDVEPGGEEPVL